VGKLAALMAEEGWLRAILFVFASPMFAAAVICTER
jgi:hypothetical protein